jgi:hypothetical protein
VRSPYVLLANGASNRLTGVARFEIIKGHVVSLFLFAILSNVAEDFE